MNSGFPQWLHRSGLVLMCVAVFTVAGGHWAVLQTVAWAKMLQEYSKDATVAEAVEKTFSGAAPCSMCREIVEAKKEEKQASAAVKLDKKAETFVAAARSLLQKPEGEKFSYLFPSDAAFAARFDTPPVPVPIFSA